MGSEKKVKRKLNNAQLVSLLHELGDALENKTAVQSSAWPGLIEGFKALTLKIKRKPDGFRVRLKVESDVSPAITAKQKSKMPVTSDERTIEYRQMKKKMKSSFKSIGEALERGRLPENTDIERFLRYSERMMGFPDCGKEHFADYRKACAHFLRAYEQADLEALREYFGILRKQRSDCHARYK